MNWTFSRENFVHTISRATQSQLLSHLKLKYFGLNNDEVKKFAELYGDNSKEKNKFHWFYVLLRDLFNPFNIILLLIAIYNICSFFLLNGGDFQLISMGIILLMVFISSLVSYVQDIKTFLVTKKLIGLVSNKATVIRLKNSEKVVGVTLKNNLDLIRESKEIEIDDLVQGDLVYLSSGDIVPCDVRILWSNDLFINQSSLTGESLPVEKHAVNNLANASLVELQNICLAGTSVISGSAIAIAIGVGKNTYFSAISKVTSNRPPETSFHRGIRRTTWLLIGFMLVMVPIVFIVNGLTKNDWISALLFSISVAVGLTPEMLPMIVTYNLARGAGVMSKSKVVVKSLEAIQNLGAIDILCTDKTGTLTNDNIELINYVNLENKSNDRLLQFLYLNSYFQTGLKNSLDKAIIHFSHNKKYLINNQKFLKVDEIPFDFNRRKLTVVVKEGSSTKHTLICKGAIEEVLKSCTQLEYLGKVIPLTDQYKTMIINKASKFNEEGLRVVTLAYKPGHDQENYYSFKDETNLIFLGFATFLDKPKPSAAKMIQLLHNNGVELKILTGDNAEITKAICQRVNLKITGLISGDMINDLSETELKKIVEVNNVFVKLNPLQKALIINTLKNNNHTVGFMGDGINDAPVLRQSDVAISVNNATDIAKDASDIILLEKSLLVLEKGIISGRHIFGNILKYIKITISSNFGNVLSVLIASAWLPFEPMAPIQIIFQNLLYDCAQLTIVNDRVDESFLARPQAWTNKDLLPFVFINGPVSSIFDIVMFLILGYYFNVFKTYNDSQQLYFFHTGWFVLGLISQTLIVQMYRTEHIPFFKSHAVWQVNISTIVVTVIALGIPFTAIGKGLELMPLPGIYFAFLFAILIAYCLLSQLVKFIYIKIYHRWL